MSRPWCRILALAVVLAAGTVTAAQARGGGATARVSISGRAFSPARLTIGVGDTVVFSNEDDFDHSIVADDGSFASPPLNPGRSWSHRFAKAGTYRYSCRLHPREKGIIVVD